MKKGNVRKYLNLVRPYENQWVALTEEKDEVLASAPTLIELEKHLVGVETPVVVHRVLPRNRGYATGVYV